MKIRYIFSYCHLQSNGVYSDQTVQVTLDEPITTTQQVDDIKDTIRHSIGLGPTQGVFIHFTKLFEFYIPDTNIEK
jgi:hypothetical protein